MKKSHFTKTAQTVQSGEEIEKKQDNGETKNSTHLLRLISPPTHAVQTLRSEQMTQYRTTKLIQSNKGSEFVYFLM